jgi:hypothetical protein
MKGMMSFLVSMSNEGHWAESVDFKQVAVKRQKIITICVNQKRSS